jgi:hypothetical protein
MSIFHKSLFTTSGDYLFYSPAGSSTRKFVARFKHRGPITKAKFLKELIANHSVEGYFAELETGKAPFAILRDANEDWYYGILEAFSGKSLR